MLLKHFGEIKVCCNNKSFSTLFIIESCETSLDCSFDLEDMVIKIDVNKKFPNNLSYYISISLGYTS